MKILITINYAWFYLLITHAIALDVTLQQNKKSNYLKRKIEVFKLKLHNTLENARIRRTHSNAEGESDFIPPTVQASETETSYSEQTVVAWSVVSVNGNEVVFAGTEEGHIALYYDSNLISLFSFPLHEQIHSLLSFQNGNGLWLIGLHNRAQSDPFLQMYECDNATALEDAVLLRRQHFRLSGSSLIALVNARNRIHVVVVENEEINFILSVYVWTGTQFDEVLSSKYLKGKCKSVAAWQWDSSLFIAVSLFDMNQLQVLKLDEVADKIISVQVLEGHFNFVYHFEFAGSQYLICERKNTLVLFWWNGVHFEGQQEISFEDPEPVLDISVLVLARGVVIIVVRPNLIEYYLQESSVSFIKSGSTEFPESWKLKSATVWRKDTDVYYLLPIFQDLKEVIAIKLDLFFEHKSSELQTPLFSNCSTELSTLISERKADIELVTSKLDKVWMNDKESFLPDLTITGKLESENANISEVSFVNKGVVHALALLEVHKQLFQESIQIDQDLNVTLRKSGYQELKGKYSFIDSIYASQCIIHELENSIIINGVHSQLLPSALKNRGDQTFLQNVYISNVDAVFVNISKLNNKKISDYLLLKNGHQVVKGNYTFRNIAINDLNKTRFLNNVKLSELVTTATEQIVSGDKLFLTLSASSINLQDTINGINIKELEKLAVNCEYRKRLDFVSDVVTTNLTILSLNDNDIEDFLLNSVKQSEDTDIEGLKTFSQPLHIEDDFSVAYVNGIHLNHLLDRNSDQNIFGQVQFDNATFKNVETDLINGIDLSSKAITKFGYFEIDKIVTFKQPLKVDTITVKDGATIDDVDVSELAASLMRREEESFYNPLELNNVKVVNDVVIEDDEIEWILNNLSNDVWFKSKTQSIPLVNFNELPVKHMSVNTWNTIPIENIVLSNLNDTIDSEKMFEDVVVTSISMEDGKTLNDVDYNSKHLFPMIIDALNHFRVKDLAIEGDLYLSTLNSVNVSDLMHVRDFQICNGQKIFNEVYVDELDASVLDFSTFGNKNFQDYVSEAAELSNTKIINKHFENVIGDDLEVHGFLNGRTVQEMFNSIVTLDSNKNISSELTFVNGLKMNNVFVESLVKILDVNNIVFKDVTRGNIVGKEFQGFFKANNIEVDVDINLVNLDDLQKFAFYKGRKNTVYKPLTFLADLKCSKIQVSSHSSIDGVNFEDLIQMDKESYLENLRALTMNTQNVDIFGNINGCNLSDIYGGSGHLETQAEKHFVELNIVGNLHMKNILNGIAEEDFSRLSVLLQSNTLNGKFHFDHINVTNLQFPGPVNGIDIAFIFEDAVRQHTLKGIQGKKRFRKKIFSNGTHINSLNATSLCSVNIPILYRKYLSKKTPQNVNFKKVSELKVRNVAVRGLMNGLKLPDDLILTDMDEKISAPVIWNDTVVLSSDLFIEGLVDEVDLFSFINNLVYLAKPDNISSNMIFLNDVSLQGDAVIDQINNISLNEVVKKFHEAFIYDAKTFQGILSIRSSLIVSGPINNVLLEDLNENICRVGQNEILPGITSFPRIRAFSLDVRYINNISLEHLWNHVHDIEEYTYTSLDRLTSIINHNEETISVMKDRKDSQFSLYGFFELHQVLNFGHTVRFLPIFEAGRFGESFALPTLQMIVWIKRNTPCNRSFKSILMEVQPNGTLTRKVEMNGRVFPFSLRILEDDVEGFRIHTDRNTRCNPEEQKPDIIKTIFINGIENRNVIPSPPNSVLTDAKPLEMDSGVYILISYEFEGEGERLYLFQYDSLHDTWSLHQKFHSLHTSSFDLIYVDDSEHFEIYLAVTGDTKLGLFLYHWDFKDKKFALKTSSSKSISSSVSWVGVEKEVFLLLTNEKTKIWKEHGSTFEYTNPVEVLTLLDDLVLSQEISVQGIYSFESFYLAGETFVLAVSRHLQTVYVIQYKGFNGFEVIQKINAPGVLDVTIFRTSAEDLLLAISSIAGHTRILKCVMRNNN